MQIRKTVLFITFFFSTSLIAGDCVVVVFGGAKEWLTMLPGIPTDISIDVDSAVRSEASKTGCRILTMANDTEKDFYENLKKLKSPPYNKAGTNYHLAFTDHGAPPGNKINESVILTGKGQHTTYGKFLTELKNILPKGSQVTFQTNTCWPNFSDALIANKMEDTFSICGSSSTSNAQMSWNLHELEKNNKGETIGPYGAVGLNYVNRVKELTNKFPGISDFHYQAKKGDLGNLRRQPGTTTSLAFAVVKLKEAKAKIPLEQKDISDYFSQINWKNNQEMIKYINGNPATQTQDVDAILTGGTCRNVDKNPFTNFLQNFSVIYQSLINKNLENLPNPYGLRTKKARDFLLRNQKNLSKLLATIARDRAEFIKKNTLHPREKYAEVEAQWQAMSKLHNQKLSDYFFQFRILQEGKTVQEFLSRTNDIDKKRFEKFVKCEKRPML